MQRVPMTKQGALALQEELERLKKVERPKIVNAIAEARALGDLKENAEYHAAREQQAFNEGRIIEIESKLSNAQVIDITNIPNEGKVIFGSTVTIINLDDNKEAKYQIVGEDESDIKLGKISVGSPIARALIGKLQGDVINVQTPNGLVEYEIQCVEYI